ncbi:MAG: outer membrane beta-barrel protein [Saprospiraceae bacterium]|nr:outer membrane beta-barrel protein [Lewinella sp.]
MKRLSLLSAFFLLLTISSFSQSQFGLRLGGALSKLTSQGVCKSVCGFISEGKSSLPTHQFGIAVQHSLSEKVKLHTDLLYARRGYQSVLWGQNHGYIKTFINYLSLPLNLDVDLGDSPVGVLLGLEPALLLDSYIKNGETKGEIDGAWTAMDAGVNIGFTYDLFPRLQIRCGYYFSVSSMLKTPPQHSGSVVLAQNPSMRVRSFQFDLAYFPWG